MKGLSFFVDNELFAVDINRVQKVARKMAVTHVPASPDAVVGIVNVKGRVITIFCLNELLGRKGKYGRTPVTGTVNAVIFKSISGDEDQMGLSIDKSGELIEIDDDTICLPALATGAEENFCILGIAELNDRLYRIIDIDSIINRYKNNGEKTAENISSGGIDNEELA